MHGNEAEKPLAPWRVRIMVYVVLVLVAIGSIWLIDRRAMQRMAQMQETQQR